MRYAWFSQQREIFVLQCINRFLCITAVDRFSPSTSVSRQYHSTNVPYSVFPCQYHSNNAFPTSRRINTFIFLTAYDSVWFKFANVSEQPTTSYVPEKVLNLWFSKYKTWNFRRCQVVLNPAWFFNGREYLSLTEQSSKFWTHKLPSGLHGNCAHLRIMMHEG
jgi:hypothetical protein